MKVLFALTLAAACLALAGSAKAQNYAIDWFTIDGGGGTSTGGVYSVTGTIAQPDAGTMGGGPYFLAGGFWGIIGLIQTPGAPLLAITNSNGSVVVSWPAAADGFLLEKTGAIASPPIAISWTTVSPGSYQTNSSRIFITVAMPAGNQFYRLRKP